MRDSGRLSSQEYQLEIAYRFFSGFSSGSLVGSCKEDHKPCHSEYGSHCPQTKKSRLDELWGSELLGLGYTKSQNEVPLVPVVTWQWPLSSKPP